MAVAVTRAARAREGVVGTGRYLDLDRQYRS
jgi:hypothetical protein